MTTEKKDTRFKPGFDERRANAGRKKGGTNKLKSLMEESLKRADRGSKDAVGIILEMMNGDIKGASASNRLTAAVKILELSEKYKELIDDRLSEEAEVRDKPKEEETKAPAKPIIALTAEGSPQKH